MSLDFTAVRTALASAAEAAGIASVPYVADAIDPPLFEVGEITVEFDAAFHRGLDIATVTCRLFVGTATDVGAAADLDGYMATHGPTSIKAALEADKRLGGEVNDLRVERIDGYRIFEVAGLRYLGAQVTVRLWG